MIDVADISRRSAGATIRQAGRNSRPQRRLLRERRKANSAKRRSTYGSRLTNVGGAKGEQRAAARNKKTRNRGASRSYVC